MLDLPTTAFLLDRSLRVLGDIMTQFSSCLWKCDRYSG
jgi:hypothetical protein